MLHLVRHGEVDNPDGVLYGRLPGFHLSADGRLMAKAAADFLAGRDVTVLRSSPLERALETAEPIAARVRARGRIDERLIEPWNHFEGMTFGVGDGSLRGRGTGATCATRSGRPGVSPTARSPPGCWRPWPTRRAAARGHEAVCVSHQLPIWVARRAVEGRRLWHDPRAPAVRAGQRDQLHLHRGPDRRGELRRACGRPAEAAQPAPDRRRLPVGPATAGPGPRRPRRRQVGHNGARYYCL